MRVRGMVSVWDWLGRPDPHHLAPAAMRYRAKVASAGKGDCAGCLFKGQVAAVCGEAGRLAQLAGMPDCDDRDTETGRTYIYVALALDPRQLDVIELPQAVAS